MATVTAIDRNGLLVSGNAFARLLSLEVCAVCRWLGRVELPGR